MDSFEFNKLIGGLLGTVFIVMSIGIVSDAIFAAPVPEKEGYAIVAEEATEPGGDGPGPATEVPIATRLASADVQAGEASHKKCVTCHTTEKGGSNKTGPNLWEIVNRPIATHEGFSYSAAMKEFSQGGAVKWDYEHLDHFLASPKGYIKGTAMGFAGIKKPDERANLIAYLRSLSDNPAPLPAAEAPAAENTAAPAEAAPAADAAQPAEGAAPAGEAAQPASGEAAPAAQGEAAPAENAAPAEGTAQPAPSDNDGASPEETPPQQPAQ